MSEDQMKDWRHIWQIGRLSFEISWMRSGAVWHLMIHIQRGPIFKTVPKDARIK